MSWSIGLHLGDSVVEIAGRDTAVKDAPVIKHRAFVTHGAAETVLSQFISTHGLQQVSRVQIVSPLPLRIIEAAHGAAAGILTTMGFENWLELNLPLKTQYFTARP